MEEFALTATEIDLDYEFDAVRFFDFSRQETSGEALQAQHWFQYAPGYPPAPLAGRLVPGLDLLLESHVNTSSPKSKNGDDMSLSDTDSDEIVQQGLSFCNNMIRETFKANIKSSVKPLFPRTSTLMKPTLSQLAKQKKAQQIGRSRYPKSLADKNQKNIHNVMEVPAPKRQKLDGGHLRKVGDTTQQSNFVHKDLKKDGTAIVKNVQTKMRITIPREPDLETAHRAQRLRPKAMKETNRMTTTFSTFKAHPLNKKNLESPSLLLRKRSTPQLPEFQEFHFKTSERATQHSLTTTTTIQPSNSTKVHTASAAECRTREPRRQNPVERQETCDSSHIFKALPLNKKIFTSKGDIGVFRNTKKETTVPMEFNFHTGKRVHHNLPIELFNKLSLTSDPQASTGSQLKPPRSNFLLSKGSKENRCGNFSEGQEVKHAMK